MNKLLTITSGLLVAGNAMAEFTPPALNVDAKLKFDTAYVSEGRRLLDQNFAPSVEVGLPLFDDAGELYVGLDARVRVGDKKKSDGMGGRNDVVPSIGFSYDITDIFTIDVGYALTRLGSKPEIRNIGDRNIVSAFSVDGADNVRRNAAGIAAAAAAAGGAAPDSPDAPVADSITGLDPADGMAGIRRDLVGFIAPTGKRHFHEIYVGVMADVLLDPALYFSYDCTQKKANIEGTIGHTFDLGSFGANGFAVDLGAKLGYSRAKKPLGIDPKTRIMRAWIGGEPVAIQHDVVDVLFDKKNWFYTGVNADLVYSLNEHTKARAGVAFSYNNAGKNTWINDFNKKKHNVWFSSALEFSF
jgi:hypothetical protein